MENATNKRKNRTGAPHDYSNSGDDMHVKVFKDKKNTIKKKDKSREDIESTATQMQDLSVKTGAEIEGTKSWDKNEETREQNATQKVKKKRKKMGVDLEVSAIVAEKNEEKHEQNVTHKVKKKQNKMGMDLEVSAIMAEKNVEKHEQNATQKVEKKRKKMGVDLEASAIVAETEKKGKTKMGKEVHLEKTTDGSEEGHKKKKVKSSKDSSEGINDKGGSDAQICQGSKPEKKVRFSADVEIFPASKDTWSSRNTNAKGLVHGKRFSPEEDELIKDAIKHYIDVHGLGEDGIQMVMHSVKHREVRNCWKEIALSLPWRPIEAVYKRASILFGRSESRVWSDEDYELIRSFHANHGADWKTLAEAMGRHRIHVKDIFRRIKYRDNVKKGHWGQDEYQNLFELVNIDLQLKAFEEKKTKHGMLRDNIGWRAIGDSIVTRTHVDCCSKWYQQLSSSLVVEGKWADTDDYHMIHALFNLDASCMEDVDWDNLVENRSGEVCRKRWAQMVKHIGEHKRKTFAEQIDVLAERYRPDLLEVREEYANRPAVDAKD